MSISILTIVSCFLSLFFAMASPDAVSLAKVAKSTDEAMDDERIAQKTAPPFAIAIHGGAGTIRKSKMTAEKEKAYRAKLAEATNAGYAILAKGGSSLDAVTAAIVILEDSPLFNAGRGAVYTFDKTHELDASLMNGKDKQAGAVASVKTVKNPILLAREVMDNSVHVMLSGKGAETFAQQQGLDTVNNQYFDTPRRLKSWERAHKRIQNAETREQQGSVLNERDYRYGTVGAVALDQSGNLAAGTSTGGMTFKRFGRIGDSPIIGAGTWADNESCAVSATGHGEYFIRHHVAADICSRVKYQGIDIQAAAHAVIHDVLLPINGTGGVIVVDTKGNIALVFNTLGMYRAFKTNSDPLQTGIFKES